MKFATAKQRRAAERAEKEQKGRVFQKKNHKILSFF